MPRISRNTSKEWGFQSDFQQLSSQLSQQHSIKKHDDTCWLTKYAPKTRNELVVHKKKLEQVKQALTNALTCKRNKVLVLSGPSGIGKSATVRAMARDMNCSLEEWVNPIMKYEKGVYYEPEITKFKNFLLSSSRYNSLFEQCTTELPGNSKKIVLIEELPSIVASKQEEFWAVIKTYSREGVYPVVLIISDGVKNVRIPQEYHNIPFNPVASTLLTKALKHICKLENLNDNCIDDIVLESDGDLRNAILTLQFHSKAENGRSFNKRRKIVPKKSSKLNGSKKDSRLVLFHALGKLLYAKRDESSPLDCEEGTLARRQLEFVPEDVADKCSISSGWITEFLHHNYLGFRTSIDHTVLPSDLICDSDILTTHFVTDEDSTWRQEYFAKSLVARAIVFSKDPSFVPKFTPLCRPVQRDISKTCNSNIEQCKEVFSLRHLGAGLSFLIDTIPFFKMIRYRSANPEEYKLIQAMTYFNTSNKSGTSLTEKDDGEPNQDIEVSKSSRKEQKIEDLQISKELEEEIEDFSD